MTNSIPKLILGTVQFGLRYGINSIQSPDLNTIRLILKEAKNFGISTLDTSYDYGESEKLIGQALLSKNSFNMISKYPKVNLSVKEVLTKSLKLLGKPSFYGYLVHHFDSYLKRPSIWNDFIITQREGIFQKLDFLYTHHWNYKFFLTEKFISI